jgi:3-hydroxyisobutyrate dehydrogenase-like beta-hydroxyacid dehydrogenase
MPTRETVGVIGLGIMGSAMAANVAAAGFAVVGYDVLPKRRTAPAKSGVRAARNSGDVANQAQIVITSLPSAQALTDVASEIAGAAARELTVIETSTLPIAVKEEARAVLAKRGVTLLDCPLSGTGAQAKVRDLVVYASGDRKAYRACVPVMEAFARSHHFLGPFGAGSKMKFVANLLVAIHNVSTAEAMVLGMKAGLDPATMVKVLSDGAGSSRMLQVRGPIMVEGDYSAAAMKVGVWQKDMKIIGEFARELDCPTPLFAATTPIYNAAMALGFADSDTACVCAVLEKWASSAGRPHK